MAKFEWETVDLALKASEKRLDCFDEAWKKQREWCANRFTTDRWLSENKREWDALDRLCRSRPWAKNRDKGFEYPFVEYTNAMRKTDGPWCGDEVPKIPNTRSEALSDVVTQVVCPQEYPPDWRVILFTPEFGEHRCFLLDNWSYLEPEDKVDVWVVCWQGWSKFDEMIEQVLHQVLSFADGSSTIWFAQGMGGIVAYEVAKAMENFQTPNFPFGLVVSDCPAPHLFQSDYKPYEMDGWADALSKTTDKQKKIVSDEVAMMKSYELKHGDKKKLHMPIKAFYHEEDKLGVTEDNTKAWEEYAPEMDEGFELLDALDEVEFENYIAGKGYALDVDPAIVGTISEMGKVHQRYPENPEWPDIGDTDGPIPAEVDILVVGCGINGIYQAMEFKRMTKKSILQVDRGEAIGGVWNVYGNDYSRVNTSEIGYRWWEKDGVWSRPNEDHTPKYDMMYDMYQMSLCNKGNIRFNINVEKVVQRDDEKYEVTLKHVKKGTEHKIVCGFVSLHVNRRIGKARDVDWEASSKFKGKICYGYRNEVRGLNFWNKDCMIIGAGAFAFENVRSAIEHGAHHTILMGRRDGTTCPKWIDMIAFLRPLDKYCNTGKSGAAHSFEVWKKCYTDAGLHTPACWAEGLLKPHNHTISVSDLAFVGGFHGLFDVKVGEIARISDDGLAVILKSDERIDREIIIKCTGFHLNHEVEPMTGHAKMFPSGLIKFNLNYGAEPLLDGGQFGSSKGQTEFEFNLGFTDEEFKQGMEVFKKKGYNEMIIAPFGNPFGSGLAGGGRMLSRYMAWLVDNPAEQKAMLAMSGEAEQNVVEFWASTQGKLSVATTMRMIASLSKAIEA